MVYCGLKSNLLQELHYYFKHNPDLSLLFQFNEFCGLIKPRSMLYL